MDNVSSILTMSTNNNTMSLKNIYKELQLIDEFHADFHPTVESESRKTELIEMLENTMKAWKILNDASIKRKAKIAQLVEH